MSLRDEYFAGSTGVSQKMQDAHDAGVALVEEGQYETIVAGLQANAALGLKKFTVTVPVTYSPAALRNNKGDNLILKAFFSGMSEALSEELVYDFECELKLNTSDSVNTLVDLNFNFA
jgi:pyridoxine 5'-phosphate synthase PdxJ